MPEPLAPTPRELEILKILWEAGPSSVRDVYQRMPAKEDLAYNTVQSFLRTMEEKGLVRHHLEGRAFIYTAIYTRQESVRGFLDRVFDGAAEELLTTLLEAEPLSAAELERLQARIQAARKKRSGR